LLSPFHGQGRDADAATIDDLDEYVIARQIRGMDSRTRAKARSAVKAFYRFLVLDRRIARSPARLLPTPKKISRLPRFLSVEDVERLIAACDVETANGMRDRALLELIYSAGLRVNEALGLTVGNVALSDESVLVMGKDSRQRRALIGGRAARYLSEYIERARPLMLHRGPSDRLFISRWGLPLSWKTVWKVLQELAVSVGIGSKVHTFRHSFATHLLDGGAGIQEVQALLGHASITSTEIYTPVSQEKLREEHGMFHPRA
jgi:integrase/recombinase XerD